MLSKYYMLLSSCQDRPCSHRVQESTVATVGRGWLRSIWRAWGKERHRLEPHVPTCHGRWYHYGVAKRGSHNYCQVYWFYCIV